jgi:hypothetical protein
MFIGLFVVLVYTRFVGLDWGLPYPMHPDERNMAVAIQQLQCDMTVWKDCFNPRFFAYGQLPLYVSYFIVQLVHFTRGKITVPISYDEAVMALRFISASAAVLTVWVMMKIVKKLKVKSQKLKIEENSDKLSITNYELPITFLVFSFSPGLIQFAHFGTTESVLMLFYTLLIYLAMQLLQNSISLRSFVYKSGIITGLAIAVKVSSLIFVAVPGIALLWYVFTARLNRTLLQLLFYGTKYIVLTAIMAIVLSPYNILDMQGFLGSFNYESSVGTGTYIAFYTKQFIDAVPVIFQFFKSFPYVLGWPVLLCFIFGFFFLPRTKGYMLLRLSFLIYFLPSAFIYAKWTRFMAPVFPVMLIIGVLFLMYITELLVFKLQETRYKLQKIYLPLYLVSCFLIFCISGLAYLSVYHQPDVRFTASKWIFNNVKNQSYILSETANVVDVPIPSHKDPVTLYMGKTYQYISFNFYDLEDNPLLQSQLQGHIQQADYIFVPSRRVFRNFTCFRENGNVQQEIGFYKERCNNLKEKYPTLYQYYEQLFSGRLGFKKVAEFTSYPKISLLGITLLELPDEDAEETWTVFDHPVIRVYQREK